MSDDREVTIKIVGKNLSKEGFDAARRELLGLKDDTAKAQAPITSIAGAWKSLTGTLAVAGIVSSAAGAVVTMGRASLATAGNLMDLNAQTGVSVEMLQRWAAVSKLGGLSADEMANHAFKLGVRLAGGQDSTRSAVERLGLSFEALRAMRPEDQMHAVMVAADKMGPSQERNAILVDLFGQTGARALATVVEGYEQTAAAATVASASQVEALDAIGDAWDGAKAKTAEYVFVAATGIAGFVRDVKSQFDSLRGLAPADFASLLGVVMTSGVSPGQIVSALAQTGAAAREAATDIELLEDTSRDYAVELATTRAAVKALTDEQRAQIDAALRLEGGISKAAEATGISEKVIRVYTQGLTEATKAKREADKAAKELAKTMADSIVWGDGIAYAALWMKRLRDESQALELRGVKGLKQIFEFEPDYGMASFEEALQLRAEALRGFHAKHEKDLRKIFEFHGDPGIGLFTAALEKRAKTIHGTLGAAMKEVPNVIMRALEGGGDIGKSLGAMFGSKLFGEDSDLVKSLSGGLTKALGKTIGGTLGSMLPGLGTMLGAGLGALTDKLFKGLFGGVSAEVKAARTEIAQFQADLAKTATEAQRNEAAGRDWAQTLIVVRDAITDIGGNASEAETLVAALFDDKHPERSRAAMERINEILAEQKALTQDLLDEGTYTWEDLERQASEYGVELSALGPQFAAAKMNEKFSEMLTFLGRVRQANGDVGAALEGVKDEISAMVVEARRAGVALPENLREYIEELARTGRLLDENGEKITDTSQLVFTEPLEVGVGRLIDEIRNLIKEITRIPPKVTTEFHTRYTSDGEAPDHSPRSPHTEYEVGTKGVHGSWFARDFGVEGELVRVHRREAIVPANRVGEFLQDIGAAGAAPAPDVTIYVAVDPVSGAIRQLDEHAFRQVQERLTDGRLRVPLRIVGGR